MKRDVAVGLGIGWLFGNVEGELFIRDELGDAFLDHDTVTENALPIRADEIPAVRGCRRIRKP